MYKSDIGYKVKQFGVRAIATGGVLLVLAGVAWGGTKLYSKIQENKQEKPGTVMVDTSAYNETEEAWFNHVKNHNCKISHTDAERLNQIYSKLITLGKGAEGDQLEAKLINHMEGCEECNPVDDGKKDETTKPTEKPTDPTEKPTDPTEEPTDPTEKPTDPTDVTIEEKDPIPEESTTPTEKPTTPPEETTTPTEKPTTPPEETFDVIIEPKPNPEQ